MVTDVNTTPDVGPADPQGDADSSEPIGTPETCGNGFCDLGETEASCPEDCIITPTECGDGICDVGETCDTCSDDCTLCGATCWDVRDCVNDCGDSQCKLGCLTSTAGGDQLSICLSGCSTDACFDECFATSEDPETVLYGEYNSCYNSCSSNPECDGTTCLPVKAACLTGGIYGEGGCYDYLVCFNTCTGTNDSNACVRDCGQTTTQQGIMAFYVLNDCVADACPSLSEACIGAAVGDGGACEAEVNACD